MRRVDSVVAKIRALTAKECALGFALSCHSHEEALLLVEKIKDARRVLARFTDEELAVAARTMLDRIDDVADELEKLVAKNAPGAELSTAPKRRGPARPGRRLD